MGRGARTKVVAVAAAALAVLGPTAARADTTPTTTGARAALQAGAMAALKARGRAEIDRRLTQLTRLQGRVTDTRHLGASDRSALAQQLGAEVSGLTALEAKIEADSDPATLRTDLRSIVTAYRVYLLMTPKVHLVGAADAVADVTGHFATLSTKVQAAITRGHTAGMDVTHVNALLADATAKVGDAQTTAAGVPGSVLPLQPTGYPGNRPTLEAARQALQAARDDLRTARSDLHQIVDALRAFRQSSTTSTTP